MAQSITISWTKDELVGYISNLSAYVAQTLSLSGDVAFDINTLTEDNEQTFLNVKMAEGVNALVPYFSRIIADEAEVQSEEDFGITFTPRIEGGSYSKAELSHIKTLCRKIVASYVLADWYSVKGVAAMNTYFTTQLAQSGAELAIVLDRFVRPVRRASVSIGRVTCHNKPNTNHTHVNNKSDFILVWGTANGEPLPNGEYDVDFYTDGEVVRSVNSLDSLIVKPIEGIDNKVRIVFDFADGEHFANGILSYTMRGDVQDADFPDGYRHFELDGKTDIEIWDGPSDSDKVSATYIPSYMKLNFSDLTEEDIALLQAPSIETAREIATEIAGTAAEAALKQGDYASEQGDYAKEQGDYAQTWGNHAMEQGDYAKVKGDYAKTTKEQIEAAESLRVNAEKSRNTNESEREQKEINRNSNELDRQAKESERSSAEAQRVANEEQRQANTTKAINNANTAADRANAIADELENVREEVATTEQLEQLKETVSSNYSEFVNAKDELAPITIDFDFADVINNPSGIEISDAKYTSLIFGIIDRKQMFAKYNGKQIPIVAYSEETNPVNLHIHAMYGDTNVLYATVGNSRIMKGGITPGGGSGGIAVETDPIFSASAAASITADDIAKWSGKQDAIADLDAIRSGAAKGATALQTVPSEYVTQTELEDKLEELGIGRTVKHTSDEQVVTIEPNTFHVWDSVCALYVTLGEAKEGEKSEYLFQFTAGVWLYECLIDAPFPFRFGTSIEWKYGHTYLVHIVNGNGTVYEYEPYVPEDEIWFYTDGTLIAPNLSNLSDKYGPIAYTYDAYAGKHILKIEGAWISEIPDSTFEDSNLWSVMLPSVGVRIGNYAFSDCENLQDIYMPFARKIGIEAFRDCPIGGTIDLGYCESIGEGAFEGTSVHEIIIPQSITTIPVNCFYGCWNLHKVKLPEGLKAIDAAAFSDCSNLKDITIPSTVELIGQEAFRGCTSLKKIEVPSGVLELFDRCFAGCTSLEEVIWHEGKSGIDSRSIYSQVFDGCTNLRKVTIPEGVIDIQNEVFANTAISTLVLPSTVADINSYAFGQMPNLQTIYCKAPRPPYVDSGFMMQVSTIYVPEGIVGSYQLSKGWSEFANVIVGRNFAGPWDANLANYYDKRELPEPAAYVLNTEQTLTEEQKEQARKNIGAASTSYIISVFEEIKALIKNGDYDEVVAVLDKAILDFATLG